MRFLFFGLFGDQGALLLVIHFGIFVSSKHLFISIASLSWMAVILKPESMYAIMASRFPIRYFSECCSERIDVYFRLSVVSELSIVYRLVFSFMLSLIVYSKIIWFLVIQLLVCLRVFSANLPILFDSVSLSFIFPSFDTNFFLICTGFVVCFNRWVFSFHLKIFPIFFLCLIFACSRRFLICVSSLISHPDFEFLFVFFWGTPVYQRLS